MVDFMVIVMVVFFIVVIVYVIYLNLCDCKLWWECWEFNCVCRVCNCKGYVKK